jgi:hypothetical protein
MKRAGPKTSTGRVIALALTWDGARWPVHTLPPKARAFLGEAASAVPSTRKITGLFSGNLVREIRICWTPRLKGGNAVLSEPFQAVHGVRIAFRSTKAVHLGDILGVVYRRTKRNQA